MRTNGAQGEECPILARRRSSQVFLDSPSASSAT